MNQELDDLLCQRYPDIFRNRHGDPVNTGMCWGFACGDGWFDIVDGLCADISAGVAAGQMPPVVATQVKAKAGFLRFHIVGGFDRSANPRVHELIRAAQLRSERTCEGCGQIDAVWAPGVVCSSCGAVRSF